MKGDWMISENAPPKTIDEYIAGFPKEVQEILKSIRATIHSAAPEVQETIKYGMPTFMLHGNLVYFAAYKNHIGFYPRPANTEFKEKLSVYKGAKGTVQFQLDQPIPYNLIREIVTLRVMENVKKAEDKGKTAK
jgi:uncharacterized protein YdhG (YjbR/CyaY superfamily)